MARQLLNFLRRVVPAKVQRSLKPLGQTYSLGAELSTPPPLPSPSYDLAKRDRLFSELQRLRADPEQRNSPRVTELEGELNALLDDRLR